MQAKRLTSCAAIFVTEDVEATANYYRNVLGFRLVAHYDKQEKFAALYRDAVEIVVIQSALGKVLPNQKRYGVGSDVYLVTADAGQTVDALHREFSEKGVKIVQPPAMTDYGNYEFTFEDIDGRWLACGRIRDEKKFFGE